MNDTVAQGSSRPDIHPLSMRWLPLRFRWKHTSGLSFDDATRYWRALWSAPVVPHYVQDVGDSDLHIIAIELKQP